MAAPAPKFRHEFVGMMFAITIGEIGLQSAALVQARHFLHFSPAYSHLILATFVVAASWVGWSQSLIPGARKDVEDIFSFAFVVLLLDMAMVVTYFILVRTVDFSPEGHRRIDQASTVAKWHALIFLLYVAWDVVTKIFMYEPDELNSWMRAAGARMVPTLICLLLSICLWRSFRQVDEVHELTADLALFCLVMLFRSLKNLVSAVLPRKKKKDEAAAQDVDKPPLSVVKPLIWSLALTIGLVASTWASLGSWSLPDQVVQAIHAPVQDHSEPHR